MRRFQIFRPNPPDDYEATGVANAPDEVQLEGCVFSDGTVAIRWLTEYRSFSCWADYATFESVHGHPEYGTVVRWLDDDEGHEMKLRLEVLEAAAVDAKYTKAYQILQDLDRCQHGRHMIDHCLMHAGGNAGNPNLRPGQVIGYTVHGHQIVMPEDAAERVDPAKWIRIVR
jgi:hypothetical protein